MLTLSEAVKTGRLQEFIAQEEARGIGSIERSELDSALAKMIALNWSASAANSSSDLLMMGVGWCVGFAALWVLVLGQLFLFTEDAASSFGPSGVSAPFAAPKISGLSRLL